MEREPVSEFSPETLKRVLLANKTANDTLIQLFRKLCYHNEDEAVLRSFRVDPDGCIMQIPAALEIKPPKCEFGVFSAPADDPPSTLAAKNGAIDVLFEAIQGQGASRAIVCNALACVMLLTARNSTNQTAVGASKFGIPVLAKCIMLDHESTLFWCCGTMRNIARDDSNMQPLVSHGVVPRLLDLLSSPSDAIKEAAGGAFWNIAWGGAVDISTNGGSGLANIVGLLKHSNLNLVNCACSILMNLTMNFNEDNKAIVADAGAIPPLVDLLNSPVEKIQFSASGALSNIATRSQTQAIIGEHGAIPLLLKLLESPNDTVVDSAAGALWNLAQDSDNKQRIGPEGIKQFLSLLQEPHAPEVVENIIGCMAQMCLNHKLRDTLRELGGIPIFAGLLSGTESEKTIVGISQMLYDLSWATEGYNQIKTHQEVFVKLLKELRNSSDDVVTTSLAALYNFAWHDGALIIDGLDSIVAALDRVAPSVVANALDILIHLLGSFPDRVGTVEIIQAVVKVLGFRREIHLLGLRWLNEATTSKVANIVGAFTDIATAFAELEMDDEILAEWKSLLHQVLTRGWSAFRAKQSLTWELRKFLSNSHTLSDEKRQLMVQLEADFRESVVIQEIAIPAVSPEISMGFLVNNPLYSDIALIIDGTRLHAHKNVLHGRSQYFRAMFESGMVEAGKNELEVQTEHSADVWLELLRFIYTDSCNVNETNVTHLLEMADQYNHTKLATLCEQFLMTTITHENAYQLLRVGVHYHATQLKERVLEWLFANIDFRERQINEEETDLFSDL